MDFDIEEREIIDINDEFNPKRDDFRCKHCGGKLFKGRLKDRSGSHTVSLTHINGGIRWQPMGQEFSFFGRHKELEVIGLVCENCRRMEFIAIDS